MDRAGADEAELNRAGGGAERVSRGRTCDFGPGLRVWGSDLS